MPPNTSAGPPVAPDIAAQMQQGDPNQPQPSSDTPMAGQFLASQLSQDNVMARLSAIRKIKQVMPLLNTMAEMVPALSQDVNEVEKAIVSRTPGIPMGPTGPPQGMPPGMGAAAGGAPSLPGPAISPEMGAAQLPPDQGQTALGGQPDNGTGQPSGPQGVMGLAVQIEVLLPQIAASDPGLQLQIEQFIKRMRVEVPKVLQQQGGATPPPTDEMLARLPATA